jgi:hypothetical protein
MQVQRRARDRDGSIIPPITLANMRENGVCSILATCETCQHEAVLSVHKWPADMPVPDIGLKLRCSASAAETSQPGRTGANGR